MDTLIAIERKSWGDEGEFTLDLAISGDGVTIHTSVRVEREDAEKLLHAIDVHRKAAEDLEKTPWLMERCCDDYCTTTTTRLDPDAQWTPTCCGHDCNEATNGRECDDTGIIYCKPGDRYRLLGIEP